MSSFYMVYFFFVVFEILLVEVKISLSFGAILKNEPNSPWLLKLFLVILDVFIFIVGIVHPLLINCPVLLYWDIWESKIPPSQLLESRNRFFGFPYELRVAISIIYYQIYSSYYKSCVFMQNKIIEICWKVSLFHRIKWNQCIIRNSIVLII